MAEFEITASPEETEAFGKALAPRLLSGELPSFVAFYGDLGVGKTAMIRGIVGGIAPGAAVRSPTFALVNEYRGGKKPVFHFDMYRITGEDDLYSIGYDDYLAKDAVCLVEWSENIPFALPDDYLEIRIAKCDPEHPEKREIRVAVKGKERLC